MYLRMLIVYNITQYADDTMLYTIVKNPDDMVKMQNDFDTKLQSGLLHTWQFFFSFDKCKRMANWETNFQLIIT